MSISCVDFGKKLITSKDLDPIYILLWEAKFCEDKLKRWLLAYWCFYHLGTTSWIAEAKTDREYWERFEKAAESSAYARCPERRHFRGMNAIKSVAFLRAQGIDRLFRPLMKPQLQTASEVMAQVKTWVGFGPWISIKVADMLERLALARIAFDTETVFLFDSPQEGAYRLYKSLREPNLERGQTVNSWACSYLIKCLPNFKAPPRYERFIGPQEVETVLCKWKSYQNGHYTLGEDIESCRKILLEYSKLRTCQTLLNYIPEKGVYEHPSKS